MPKREGHVLAMLAAHVLPPTHSCSELRRRHHHAVIITPSCRAAAAGSADDTRALHTASPIHPAFHYDAADQARMEEEGYHIFEHFLTDQMVCEGRRHIDRMLAEQRVRRRRARPA